MPAPNDAVARLVALLDLPDEATWILQELAVLDLNAEAARAVLAADPHQRPGVVGWTVVQRSLASLGRPALEAAALALQRWGLVQIVGLEPGEPTIPGDLAIRLSAAGHAVMELGPLGGDRAPVPEACGPWQVRHGASREWLVSEALADRPEVRLAPGDNVHVLAGQVAMRLCAHGRVVLDATRVDGRAGWETVAELVLRTRRARGERVLLLLDPAPIRGELAVAGAALRWSAPDVEAQRDTDLLDRRVSAMLARANPGARQADLLGVPFRGFAPPLPPRVVWEDVLVSPTVQHQLSQALAHARYRTGARGASLPARYRGYKLLLTGSPGTGKSMVGEALAAELGTLVMKLDLATVLSRWLGETERTLGDMFDLAESAGAVLVLDEAEALLRQREGSGGGEAMATAVAYLLTRIERYSAVLVATSNRIQSVDEAFFRRFDDYIIMPIPDAEARRRIWDRALPAEAVVDRALLAERFAISGALVVGASLRAAAWASEAGEPLRTAVVLASLARELEKSDRAADEVLIEPYRAEVEALLHGVGSP